MPRIIVVGLGSGDYKQLTLEAFDVLKNSESLILRTEKHPCVEYLRKSGISFESCDDLYESEATFEDTYRSISDRIIERCLSSGEVVYAVPGHPLVAEKTVELLIDRSNGQYDVDIIPAVSFIDAVLTALRIDPVKGLKVVDALSLDMQKPDTKCGNIVTQVYNRYVASETKLKLMEYYNDDYELYIIRAAGVSGLERIEKIPLYDLDRIDWVDYLTSLYIPAAEESSKYRSMDDLVALMKRLRGEDGCPWDREQTRVSLKPYLLEETYEVLDAIEKDDIDLLIEELGDLLLQVVFHAQIAAEDGEFDINDIITGIVNKLILRHPHVFGDVKATSESGALKSWEASKRKQKGIVSFTQTLTDIPEALPSLIRSYKIQQKAALAGFDWTNIEDVMDKVAEELDELKEVYKGEDKHIIEEELGDLLFSVVNLARFLKIQPELALRAVNDKFISRFRYIEENATKQGKKMEKMSLEELDELWESAKMHNLSKKD
ncbi:MAG: nucleoside triphosphate pyrophosphohydrolase [Bacillota bacterium]